jgi:hypothetical protein
MTTIPYIAKNKNTHKNRIAPALLAIVFEVSISAIMRVTSFTTNEGPLQSVQLINNDTKAETHKLNTKLKHFADIFMKITYTHGKRLSTLNSR